MQCCDPEGDGCRRPRPRGRQRRRRRCRCSSRWSEAEIRDHRVVFRLFCGGGGSAASVGRTTSRARGEMENVKEAIGKSLAPPVLRCRRLRCAHSVEGKSATAVTKIDAAEIINKRKPRTKNTESKERSASLHCGERRHLLFRSSRGVLYLRKKERLSSFGSVQLLIALLARARPCLRCHPPGRRPNGRERTDDGALECRIGRKEDGLIDQASRLESVR